MTKNNQDCPFCTGQELHPTGNGDWLCPQCERQWYLHDIGYGEQLVSRPRRVIMKKMPEVGDRFDDCIEPVMEN